ncbi:MAG: phospholipase D-like domain-containing protein [Nannocystaceae bacterium]
MAERLALFNHPDWNSSGKLVSSDSFLIDQVIGLLNQAEEGCQVRMTVSGWDVADSQVQYDGILNAMKSAVARGVDIKFVAPMLWTPNPDDPEDKIEWFQMRADGAVISELDKLYRGNIRHWPGSQELCRNINHNKFICFSQLRGAESQPKWVVANMSCNWRYRDRDRPNDMLLFAEDRGVYLAFLRYWQALWMASGQAQSLPKYKVIYDDIPAGLRVYFLPLPDGSTDPVLDLLNSVIVTSGTKVRVVMATWGYGGRGKTILDKLLSLSNAGADVRVIAHHELQFNHEEEWRRCSLDPLDDVNTYGYCETTQAIWEKMAAQGLIRWAKSSSHSKYILVDGPLVGGGAQTHRVVLTGPLNFGNPVTYSDCAMAENVVVLRDDDAIYQRYLDNFNWLCQEAWRSSNLTLCGD